MQTINGKTYTLWPQFVEKKNQWIGGDLIDFDHDVGLESKTKIKDITFTPNGKDSAMFSIIGEDFTCECDVEFLGVGGHIDRYPKGSITFTTRFGSDFTIVPTLVNEK